MERLKSIYGFCAYPRVQFGFHYQKGIIMVHLVKYKIERPNDILQSKISNSVSELS